jgi:hypothetical protein
MSRHRHHGRRTIGPLLPEQLDGLRFAELCACCGMGDSEERLVHVEHRFRNATVKIPSCRRCAPHVDGEAVPVRSVAAGIAALALAPFVLHVAGVGVPLYLAAAALAAGVVLLAVLAPAIVRASRPRRPPCSPISPAIAFHVEGDAAWLLFANRELARATSQHTGHRLGDEGDLKATEPRAE